MLITPAIYEILNVALITDLVGDISPVIASPTASPPYLIINERGIPEHYKGGYSVVNHTLQIDIYASKGKDNAGGYAVVQEIAVNVESLLNQYNGIVAGISIDGIYMQSTELLFETESQLARIMMEYVVRVNIPQPDPEMHWITDTGMHLITDTGMHLIFK